LEEPSRRFPINELLPKDYIVVRNHILASWRTDPAVLLPRTCILETVAASYSNLLRLEKRRGSTTKRIDLQRSARRRGGGAGGREKNQRRGGSQRPHRCMRGCATTAGDSLVLREEILLFPFFI
jgi:hypothetical protein